MNNNSNSLFELMKNTATGLFSKLQNMFSLSLFQEKSVDPEAEQAAREAKEREYQAKFDAMIEEEFNANTEYFSQEEDPNNPYASVNTAGEFWDEDGGGLNLQNNKGLQQNKEIVINCVKENGLALQFADDSLQEDEEVVKFACENDSNAFQFAADRLTSDHEFVKEMYAVNPATFEHAAKIVKDDMVFLEELSKINAKALQFADDQIKNDHDFVKVLYAINPATFEHAAQNVKDDMVFLEELAQLDPDRSFKQYLSDEVRKEYGEESPKSPGP